MDGTLGVWTEYSETCLAVLTFGLLKVYFGFRPLLFRIFVV